MGHVGLHKGRGVGCFAVMLHGGASQGAGSRMVQTTTELHNPFLLRPFLPEGVAQTTTELHNPFLLRSYLSEGVAQTTRGKAAHFEQKACIFVIYLMYWINLMSFIYVTHLMC